MICTSLRTLLTAAQPAVTFATGSVFSRSAQGSIDLDDVA